MFKLSRLSKFWNRARSNHQFGKSCRVRSMDYAGVRPSPGAATLEPPISAVFPHADLQSCVAAPGDGRTPALKSIYLYGSNSPSIPPYPFGRWSNLGRVISTALAYARGDLSITFGTRAGLRGNLIKQESRAPIPRCGIG